MTQSTQKRLIFFSPIFLIFLIYLLSFVPTSEELQRKKSRDSAKWTKTAPEFLRDKKWHRQVEKATAEDCDSYYSYYSEGQKTTYYGDSNGKQQVAKYLVYQDYIEIIHGKTHDFYKIHNNHLDLYEENYKEKMFLLFGFLTEKPCI